MFELVRASFAVCPASAVDFAAVLDGGDVEGVADVVEAEAIVANAEPELGRRDHDPRG